MIATCPACATRYNLPDEAIGSKGRIVRCVNCGHKWRQTMSRTEEITSVGDIPLTGRDIPLSARMEGRQPVSSSKSRKSVASKSIAAALILIILFAGVAGLILFKPKIIAAWPPMARLYVLFDSPVKVLGEGLALQDVQAVQHTENGATLLSLQGKIQNISVLTRAVPLLKATLVNDSGPVRTWTFPPSAGTLAPGASLPFINTLNDVNVGAGNVLLTFTADNTESKK